MLKEGLAYLDTDVKAPPTLVDRCFRTVINVGNVWTLLASVLLSCTLSTPGLTRTRAAALVCLAISAAIYSVALPLRYVLNKHLSDSQR